LTEAAFVSGDETESIFISNSTSETHEAPMDSPVRTDDCVVGRVTIRRRPGSPSRDREARNAVVLRRRLASGQPDLP